MADKEFILTEGGDVTISARAAQALIGSRDGDAALLYIFLLRSGGMFDTSECQRALGFGGERLGRAVSALRKMSLVNAAAPLPDEPERPGYSASEVLDEMEAGGEFFNLVKETEKRLKLSRKLNVEEMKRLMGLYAEGGLPIDVLHMLVTWCAQEYKRRYGDSRRPTVRAIESEGWRWARMGLDNEDAATKYIKNRIRSLSEVGRVTEQLGIGGRRLSPSEEKYIGSWLEWGYKLPEIALAYDKTVLNTGSMNWKYMNSILRRWHDAGLLTLADIESRDKPAPRQSGGGDVADSLERIRSYRERNNSQ